MPGELNLIGDGDGGDDACVPGIEADKMVNAYRKQLPAYNKDVFCANASDIGNPAAIAQSIMETSSSNPQGGSVTLIPSDGINGVPVTSVPINPNGTPLSRVSAGGLPQYAPPVNPRDNVCNFDINGNRIYTYAGLGQCVIDSRRLEKLSAIIEIKGQLIRLYPELRHMVDRSFVTDINMSDVELENVYNYLTNFLENKMSTKMMVKFVALCWHIFCTTMEFDQRYVDMSKMMTRDLQFEVVVGIWSRTILPQIPLLKKLIIFTGTISDFLNIT
tara:strand:+ start:137 stop:958 length:822 start_codon:yes stop_codon:yes gene_type:complete